MSHPHALLQSLGAAPLKHLSQNFLVSPHWAERLAREATQADCTLIWEIGPGLGALTEQLVKHATVQVELFEIDRKLASYLRTQWPKLTLHEGDVLKFPLEALSQGQRLSVLSNLPYHLGAHILDRLSGLPLVQAVLTFQREFAERLKAPPSSPAYGALSVTTQVEFEIQSLGVLPPGAFYPVPDVDSEALRLRPRSNRPDSSFRTFVRAAFAQRRKKLKSNLARAYPAVDWDQALGRLGVRLDARAENLSPAQFLALHPAVALGPASY